MELETHETAHLTPAVEPSWVCATKDNSLGWLSEHYWAGQGALALSWPSWAMFRCPLLEREADCSAPFRSFWYPSTSKNIFNIGQRGKTTASLDLRLWFLLLCSSVWEGWKRDGKVSLKKQILRFNFYSLVSLDTRWPSPSPAFLGVGFL